MTVNTLTLYMPGSSVGIQVWEGSQLHLILVSQGANSIPSAPGQVVRQDPFPQYVDADELAAALAGVGGGGGAVASVNGKTGTVVLNAADVGASPTGHGHAAADISDSTATGRSLLTAADAAAARTAAGAAAATHTHGVADLTATGTRSATTFLRGDSTWAVPPTGGGATGLPATIYVAASDATDFEKELAGPTYTCDGTADDVQIQAAIDFVKFWGGGKALLSPGNFHLAAPVVLAGEFTASDYVYRTIGLHGAGRGSTALRPASGIESAIRLAEAVQANITDLIIHPLGNSHGITGVAQFRAGLQPHACTFFSTIKNVEVSGTYAGDGTGYGLHLENVFRLVAENFEVNGMRNGIRLYSSGTEFHPGNSVFIRCFVNVFGNNGYAYRVESSSNNAQMNQMEFILCEALSNGTGNTAVFLGGAGEVNHTAWHGCNLEDFDTIFHVDNGFDNDLNGNWCNPRNSAAANTTAFVRLGANARHNRFSFGTASTTHATRLVDSAATSTAMPNLIENTRLIVNTGGAVTNSIATAGAVISRWIVGDGAAIANASTVLASPVAAAPLAATTKTGTSYTLVAADAGTVVESNNAAAVSVTVPPDSAVAFPVGTVIEVHQLGAGQVTLAAGVGVNLRSRGGALKIAGQYGALALRKRAANEWIVTGDVTT